MSSWRVAKSLLVLLAQVNTRWPQRSHDSDGTIGDMSHSARHSDHNPVNGIVHALDITHDPAHGFNSYAFADMILKNQDRRLSYVISNRRIGSGPGGPAVGKWRGYSGINPHDHHCHISVVAGALADDETPWSIGIEIVSLAKTETDFKPAPRTLRYGMQGEDVGEMQKALHLLIDGRFGIITENALRAFQKKYLLVTDGVCGPQTWAKINQKD